VGLETSARRAKPLTLNQRDAAAFLGVSVDTFSEHVAPDLRRVKCGRLWLYPVRELEQWVERNAVEWAA
jgi:predicted nucleotidyltransferase